MKTAFIILLLGAVSMCFGAWSTNPATNASALGLTTANYEYSMAYAGTLSGFLFGLFLWKIR
jgi:hypothetical protein